jgi:hypothetical protein
MQSIQPRARPLALHQRYNFDSCVDLSTVSHLQDNPLYDTRADAQRASNLQNAHALRAEVPYAFLHNGLRSPSPRPAPAQR